MFNDVIVVGSAPDPYDPLSPYGYMDEVGISWVTGETMSCLPLTFTKCMIATPYV